MPATIYLITGGCRSGKSSYAERLCTQLCPEEQKPIYVATGSHAHLHRNDSDFQQRIAQHQQDRGDHWITIEEPLTPSIYADQYQGRAVLVDCLTLWWTNHLWEEGAFEVQPADVNDDDNNKSTEHKVTLACERAWTKLKEEFELLTRAYDRTFVFVTNEVGSGTHGDSTIARKFVDYQGWLNQYVAHKAQQVIYMVCGQPQILKNELAGVSTPSIPSAAKCNHPLAVQAQQLDRHLSIRAMPMDQKGYFLVKTDTEKCLIVVSFHSCIVNEKGEFFDLVGKRIHCHGKSPEPVKIWKCRTAKEMTTEIFERWEFLEKAELTVSHAAYIGREVQKAEHCLYGTGQEFQQD